MAAIDLVSVNTAPWPYSITGVTTNWQEVIVPAWAWLRYRGSDQVYVAYAKAGDPSSPETPADGAAPGTHKSLVGESAGSGTGWFVAEWPDLPRKQTAAGAPTAQPRRFFIAAVSGTVNVDVEVIHPSQIQG